MTTDTELLTYGVIELAAFRADMRTITSLNEGYTRRIAAARLRDVLRNQTERREAAGLSRSQAERACVLAAKAERSAR
jgi:ABC-type arginine transport system permease subunit